MTQQQTHYVIEIEPNKFKDSLPIENGEEVFDVIDVLRFLVDCLNKENLAINMILRDHELAVECKHEREWFIMGIYQNDPVSVIIDGAVELAEVLNSLNDIQSWITYCNKKYWLHVVTGSCETQAEEKQRQTEQVIKLDEIFNNDYKVLVDTYLKLACDLVDKPFRSMNRTAGRLKLADGSTAWITMRITRDEPSKAQASQMIMEIRGAEDNIEMDG